MKLPTPLLTLALLLPSVSPTPTIDFSKWHAALPGDLRSPCPALNALANHYIIPHDGRNLTVPMLVDAFSKSMNITSDFTTPVATGALLLAPDGGASGAFSLKDISVHGNPASMEHDGSLSREDYAVSGDSTTFSAKVFSEFLGYFRGRKQVGVKEAARARWGRILTSRKRNPHFSYTEGERMGSYIQTAIYLQALKDPASGKVPTEWLKVWFEQERLPWKEGWRTTQEPVSSLSLLGEVLKLALETPEEADFVTGAVPGGAVVDAGKGCKAT